MYLKIVVSNLINLGNFGFDSLIEKQQRFRQMCQCGQFDSNFPLNSFSFSSATAKQKQSFYFQVQIVLPTLAF